MTSCEIVAAFNELSGDLPVNLCSFPAGVVVLAGSVQDGISVLPHVPGCCHQFVDERHCPAQSSSMLALAAVIVLLVCCHASGYSSQLEVVPANLILCFQCPSLLGTNKMVAFDHVHCGLLVLAALRASVVVPFFAEVHGPAHSAPAGAVLAEPTSHAFGLFLESLFGSLPIGVIEGLLG